MRKDTAVLLGFCVDSFFAFFARLILFLRLVEGPPVVLLLVKNVLSARNKNHPCVMFVIFTLIYIFLSV